MEIERVQNECSLADIDFEFVIDSSGSIGPGNWQSTVDNIAKYWIQGKEEFKKNKSLFEPYEFVLSNKRCDSTKWIPRMWQSCCR